MKYAVKITAALVIITLTTALDLPSWMKPGPDWSPLSAEEIADVRTCMMESMLAICAGAKRIATGIIVAPRKVGIALSADENVDLGLPQNMEIEMFAVEAKIMIRQFITSGGPEWEVTYYVINDKQLANIIAKARADLSWIP